MPVATSTALLIGAGVAATGTAISTVQHIKAGNAAQRVGEFNAQSAEQDALVAQENAELRVMQHRTQVRQLQGRARALIGASGVELEGSPLHVLAENARQAAIDEGIIGRTGALQAEALRREAQSQRMAGSAARSASRYDAFGSLLTGGYQTATTLVPTLRLGGKTMPLGSGRTIRIDPEE